MLVIAQTAISPALQVPRAAGGKQHCRGLRVCQTGGRTRFRSPHGIVQASSGAVQFKVERSPAEDAVIRAATPFHLAIPVNDIASSRAFYGGLLGLPEGRSSERWVDYNFYGHQLVCHLVDGYNASSSANAVDGDPVPVPHFGLAMTAEAFHALAERVRKNGVKFELEPHVRFSGAPGEQWTMFFRDPSGNALEFKAMTTPENLFAQYTVKKG